MREDTVLDLPGERPRKSPHLRTVQRATTATWPEGTERRTRSVLVVTGTPVHGWRAAISAAVARAAGEAPIVFVVEPMLPRQTVQEWSLVTDGVLAADTARQLGAWMASSARVGRADVRTGTADELVELVTGTPDDVDVEVTMAPVQGWWRRLRTRRLEARLSA